MNRLLLREFGLAGALVIVAAVFAVGQPAFVSAANLSHLSVEFAIQALLALGVFLVLLPGHTDLSVGSGVGLLGAIATILTMAHHWPAGVAMLAAVAVAVVLWSLMGWIVVGQGVPAFIATLGGLLAYRGAQEHLLGEHYLATSVGGQSNLLAGLTGTYVPPLASIVLVVLATLSWGWARQRDRAHRRRLGMAVADGEIAFLSWFVISQAILLAVLLLNRHHGLPVPLLLLALTAITIAIVVRFTPFGRALYAIGGNAEAALLSGIPVRSTIIIAFAACGAVTALTGFLQTAYTGSSTPQIGTWMELDAISACVIGGVSLTGGIGTVGGVLLGALLMSTLRNGMTMLAVPEADQLVIRGVVLVTAAWLDLVLRRSAARDRVVQADAA